MEIVFGLAFRQARLSGMRGGGVPQSANGLRNENQWENWTTWFGKRNFVIGGKRENIRSRQQEKMRGLQRIMALAEGSPRHGTAQ